jgi:hypothetical protein
VIALAAAYAVALQVVVASFAVLSAVGAVPGLCVSGKSETPGSDHGNAAPCLACPASCGAGGLPGVAPAGISTLTPRAATVRVGHRMLAPGGAVGTAQPAALARAAVGLSAALLCT